ncbi:hypothetical protein BDK51DRAFT_40227 [Blyttiomyces helicus]|uniref:Uncharacterized protein n=1 Tax=Blyttiomyces helicus TaxID=388810 RepID=A0A4P9WG47_9FUNG|nr:hypothetical protein BDK51DRAFT_40227 [Blyttiomyces helicus]|eukprot:RKO90000.1 hypothetical protein BDK51DRAFT_40227 [Blyttiomyces helicus]
MSVFNVSGVNGTFNANIFLVEPTLVPALTATGIYVVVLFVYIARTIHRVCTPNVTCLIFCVIRIGAFGLRAANVHFSRVPSSVGAYTAEQVLYLAGCQHPAKAYVPSIFTASRFPIFSHVLLSLASGASILGTIHMIDANGDIDTFNKGRNTAHIGAYVPPLRPRNAPMHPRRSRPVGPPPMEPGVDRHSRHAPHRLLAEHVRGYPDRMEVLCAQRRP